MLAKLIHRLFDAPTVLPLKNLQAYTRENKRNINNRDATMSILRFSLFPIYFIDIYTKVFADIHESKTLEQTLSVLVRNV